MPIYHYRAIDPGQACESCGPGFDCMQKLAEDALRACPDCDAPIQRIISPPFVKAGHAHRLKEGHIEKHGFTQYRKVQKGVYEKTAGKGPNYIADDGK